MIKKSFKDIKLSSLGMGNMRLPTINGDPKSIIGAQNDKEEF